MRSATSSGGNLIYRGGYIQHTPNLLIVTWGFAPNDTTRDPWGEANRIIALAQATTNMANGSWIYTIGQYYGLTGSPPYTTTATGAGYVNEWADTSSSPPAVFTDAQIQNEVIRASNAIAPGSNPYGNGWTYVILTPTHVTESGFISQWCGYHSSLSYTSYSVIPYQPDAGGSCGADSVNQGSLGMLDGATIVSGHELAEMHTDPFPGGPNAGWTDSNGAEIGDKCAWTNLRNVTFPDGGSFAMQPLWSNASGGCVMNYYVAPPPTPGPTPKPGPTPTHIPPCIIYGNCGGGGPIIH